MSNRLEAIAALASDEEKANAYKRLGRQTLTAEELESLCGDIEAGVRGSAPTAWCLNNMWDVLFAAPANVRGRELAHRCLANPGARTRGTAESPLAESGASIVRAPALSPPMARLSARRRRASSASAPLSAAR